MMLCLKYSGSISHGRQGLTFPIEGVWKNAVF